MGSPEQSAARRMNDPFPVTSDKLASRHGAKGVVSKICL
jgi:DNA-directed RNA polymerase beta subunit